MKGRTLEQRGSEFDRSHRLAEEGQFYENLFGIQDAALERKKHRYMGDYYRSMGKRVESEGEYYEARRESEAAGGLKPNQKVQVIRDYRDNMAAIDRKFLEDPDLVDYETGQVKDQYFSHYNAAKQRALAGAIQQMMAGKKTRQLDEETALLMLQELNNDAAEARKMAERLGYTFE